VGDTPRSNAVDTVLVGIDLVEESERYVADLVGLGGEPIHRRNIPAHREAAWNTRGASERADISVTERVVSVGDRCVEVRLFLPAGQPKGGYLHFHGGGWVFGGAALQDAELANLSHGLGIAVLSVEYRLAPENPFPAALDDAETAALWLIRHGRRELGVGPMAIGGDSAGAHLATIALQRLTVAGEPPVFSAANLLYGIYDLSMTPSQRAAVDTPRLSRTDLSWYYDKVTPPSTMEERRSAEISPLYGDMRGMPPARFAVGTLDPLFDDSAFMAARWAAAGSSATLEVYVAGTHGLARQPTGLAVLARQREFEFLAGHLKIEPHAEQVERRGERRDL
jgi:acetyl esterase/lipase